MEDILIFPYSGTAVEALDCLDTQWNCVGFISDDVEVIGTKKFGIEIFRRDGFKKFRNARVLAVHGSPASFLQREDILLSLGVEPERFATVIHPKSSISKNAKIGRNVLIMAGVVVAANAILGDHVVVLPNAVIHHDSHIEDLTLIGANVTIAGGVKVGRNSYIGAASSIKNGIQLGEKMLVGMGANVVSSFSERATIAGNPARVLS